MIFLEKISKKSEFQLSTFQRVTSLFRKVIKVCIPTRIVSSKKVGVNLPLLFYKKKVQPH